MDTVKLSAIQLDQIVRLMHTDKNTWLKVESNKNKEAGNLTVIQLRRIVRLRHADKKTWLKKLWNPTRKWVLGSCQSYN
jgi:hypothetical protein